MDHLDTLEAESIYILREAFAKLERLAILWSLGKDSNVVLWLTRKAFFGHVPLPVLHVDTGKKFKEMYAFRDQYSEVWGLKLLVEPCPPIDQMDPTLPPAARSAARKTAGLNAALAKHGYPGPDRRHSPRRGGHPRQGALLQSRAPRTIAGTSRISRPSSGTST